MSGYRRQWVMAISLTLLLGEPPRPGTLLAEVSEELAAHGAEVTVRLPREQPLDAEELVGQPGRPSWAAPLRVAVADRRGGTRHRAVQPALGRQLAARPPILARGPGPRRHRGAALHHREPVARGARSGRYGARGGQGPGRARSPRGRGDGEPRDAAGPSALPRPVSGGAAPAGRGHRPQALRRRRRGARSAHALDPGASAHDSR